MFGDPPPRCNQEPLVVEDKDGRPQGLVVHCFFICGSGALLGGVLGISRYVEREFLSLLSICPQIFVCFLLGISYCVIIIIIADNSNLQQRADQLRTDKNVTYR